MTNDERHSPNGHSSLVPRPSSLPSDIIWALKDVSFEVKHGEVVGIIGRNGAGKSTLLKIISRITKPTSGRVIFNGRVSSLLEVGTGFHPELTGRENVYLNGTLLGMTKAEISRKFDEIVDFSGVEQFIDTPVKRYSSGMQVRLAFAVAAHLEPEILIVDEVLAVGDTEFQKKCLGKMGIVASEGRTVLFVSHNLGQIKNLCSRGLWLNQGRCVFDGPIDDTVANYQMSFNQQQDSSNHIRKPNGKAEFVGWQLAKNIGTDNPHVLYDDREVTLEILLKVRVAICNATHVLNLRDETGQKIGSWITENVDLEPGIQKLVFTIPYLPLRPGVYYWETSLFNPKRIDRIGFGQEMIMATKDYHLKGGKDGGLLNIPHEFHVSTFDSITLRNR